MIRKGIIVTRDGARFLGGPGSGNFGHAGIPGQRGGSAPSGSGGGGKASAPSTRPTQKIGQNMFSGGLDENLTPDDISKRGYSAEESKALADYKNDTYRPINKGLITGDIPPELKADIEEIDNAIDRSLVVGGATLYHGMGPSEAAAFEGMGVGSEFSNKAYYSASSSKGTGSNFGRESGKVLVIDIPHGGKAFAYGDTEYESEVLLPRNQKFTVSKIVKEGKFTYYHVS